MAKYTNVVRFCVKSGKQQEFESLFSKAEKWRGESVTDLVADALEKGGSEAETETEEENNEDREGGEADIGSDPPINQEIRARAREYFRQSIN